MRVILMTMLAATSMHAWAQAIVMYPGDPQWIGGQTVICVGPPQRQPDVQWNCACILGDSVGTYVGMVWGIWAEMICVSPKERAGKNVA